MARDTETRVGDAQTMSDLTPSSFADRPEGRLLETERTGPPDGTVKNSSLLLRAPSWKKSFSTPGSFTDFAGSAKVSTVPIRRLLTADRFSHAFSTCSLRVCP